MYYIQKWEQLALDNDAQLPQDCFCQSNRRLCPIKIRHKSLGVNQFKIIGGNNETIMKSTI
jgi:hypothetical protein